MRLQILVTAAAITGVPLAWALTILMSSSGEIVKWFDRCAPFAAFIAYAWYVFLWYITGYSARTIVCSTAAAAIAVDGARAVWGGGSGSPTRVTAAALVVAAGFLVVLGLSMRRSGGVPVPLVPPFPEGTYAVAQGGASRLVNPHTAAPGQRHALDLVKLGRYGLRARGVYPGNLGDYFAFGVPVLAPIEGRVVEIQEGLPDLQPGERDRAHPRGNYIVIETPAGVRVLLAHLRSGTIVVREGEEVTAGRTVGRIGNSGNTSEPHLHVQANDAAGEALPLAIDGRVLSRNSQITVGPAP